MKNKPATMNSNTMPVSKVQGTGTVSLNSTANGSNNVRQRSLKQT